MVKTIMFLNQAQIIQLKLKHLLEMLLKAKILIVQQLNLLYL